jgi:hypothetical protein
MTGHHAENHNAETEKTDPVESTLKAAWAKAHDFQCRLKPALNCVSIITEWRSRISKFLLEVNSAVTTVLDLHELMPEISKCLRPMFEHDAGGVGTYDEEKSTLLKKRIIRRVKRDER